MYIHEDDCAEDTDGLAGGSVHNVKQHHHRANAWRAVTHPCVWWGCLRKNQFTKVSVMIEQPDIYTMFLFPSCLLCAPNTLPHLSCLLSIGFNSCVSHVVASQLKNKLRQYGSIWAYWSIISCVSTLLAAPCLVFSILTLRLLCFFSGCHCTHP